MLDSVHHAAARLATGVFRSSPIPSLLVDTGVFLLVFRRQSLLLRFWYRVQRFPESVSCVAVSRDSHSRLCVSHPSFSKPFGVRVASVMAALNVPSVSVSPCRYHRVGYWQFQDISVCGTSISNKNLLRDYESRAVFLEHFSTHSDSILVFTMRM